MLIARDRCNETGNVFLSNFSFVCFLPKNGLSFRAFPLLLPKTRNRILTNCVAIPDPDVCDRRLRQTRSHIILHIRLGDLCNATMRWREAIRRRGEFASLRTECAPQTAFDVCSCVSFQSDAFTDQ